LRAGTTFDPTPVYVQAEVGYRKFTDSFVSAALTYSGELGVFATPRVLLTAHVEAEKARDDTKPNFLSYTAAEGLVQYGVKPHLNVMAGYARTLSGKNATKQSQLRLGVALKGNWIGRYRGQMATGAAAPPPPAPAAKAPAPIPPPSPAPVPSPAPSDTTQAPGQPK
jgi:hypothetical protein